MRGGSLRQVGGSLDHLSPDHLNYRKRSQVWGGGSPDHLDLSPDLPGSQVWLGEDQQLDPISGIALQSDDFEARKSKTFSSVLKSISLLGLFFYF